MATVETIAIFIPVLFVIGLFTAITLNIYYKYKTNTKMSEKVPLESLGEWYRLEAKAKTIRSRGMALRWGGFFGGVGLGVAIGCIIRAIISNLINETEIYYVFLIIALGIFCGGAGMVGAYFLERRLNKNTECE